MAPSAPSSMRWTREAGRTLPSSITANTPSAPAQRQRQPPISDSARERKTLLRLRHRPKYRTRRAPRPRQCVQPRSPRDGLAHRELDRSDTPVPRNRVLLHASEEYAKRHFTASSRQTSSCSFGRAMIASKAPMNSTWNSIKRFRLTRLATSASRPRYHGFWENTFRLLFSAESPK